MRLFIAIEIPEEIKKDIAEIQSNLKYSGVEAGWTRPEGIHLTLKFLGEVAQPKVPEIMTALASLIKNMPAFRLSVAGAGVFPNLKNARVAWIGISGETERLLKLQSSIESAMEEVGFKRENRPFIPHLTLGRIKNVRSRDELLSEFNRIKDIKLPDFSVQAVSLMKSDLRPSGAVYTEIVNVALT